ncbi:hypothetical protein HDU67_002425 [Dinochytrium kinnereticum]|nr:hypothetical protein HDU67_002425 [Dinochytrium kinnereticum]
MNSLGQALSNLNHLQTLVITSKDAFNVQIKTVPHWPMIRNIHFENATFSDTTLNFLLQATSATVEILELHGASVSDDQRKEVATRVQRFGEFRRLRRLGFAHFENKRLERRVLRRTRDVRGDVEVLVARNGYADYYWK